MCSDSFSWEGNIQRKPNKQSIDNTQTSSLDSTKYFPFQKTYNCCHISEWLLVYSHTKIKKLVWIILETGKD